MQARNDWVKAHDAARCPVMRSRGGVLVLALLVALPLLTAGEALAAAKTWSGNNDVNWNTGANWGGTAPVGGDNLVFGAAGSSGTSLNNNLTADINLASATAIAFNNSAASYTISGNRITLGGNITVGTGITAENINVDMILSATRTFTVSSGTLTLGGTISDGGTSGRGVTVGGSSATTVMSGANTFDGPVTVSGGTSLSSAATLSVTTVNSVSGSASSNLGHPTSSANGTINIGSSGGTAAGLLKYTGAGETSDRLLKIGGYLSAAAAGIEASGTTTSGSPLKFTGAVSYSYGNTIHIALTGTGYGEISGAIGAGSSGSGITKSGSGTWTLSGANVYTGPTKVNEGTLSVASLNYITSGSLSPNTSSSLGKPTTSGNGTIALGNSTTAGTLVYTGAGETSDRVINLAGTSGSATLDQSGSGLLKFTSAFTAGGAGSKDLTLKGSTAGTGEINAAIVNNSSGNKTAVIKSGSGTWTLSGASTYTGGTTINDGVLNAGRAQNGTTDGPLGASGNIVFGGGTLQFSAASAAWDPSSRIASGTSASAIKIDTAGESITFATQLTSTQSGGLTKLGSGTLTLSYNGTEAYSGTTTLSSGTLALSGASCALPAGSDVRIEAGGTLDVSAAAATYTLGTSATLDARGTGTSAGTTAATIKGNTTVSLGSRPVNLKFTPTGFSGDTTHPSLCISQGALTLNNNAFTVNNAGGTPLGSGTYRLIEVAGGTINQAGSPSYTVNVTGSGIAAGGTAIIAVSGGSVNLTVSTGPSAYKIEGSATQTAGASQSLTITALSGDGNTMDYDGDVNVTFSGLADSPDGSHPTVTDKNGAAQNFGTVETLTFLDGVCTAGGALVPKKAEGPVTVHLTDNGGKSSSSGTGASGLSLTVGPATAVKLAITGSGTQTAGVGQNLTITAKDPYGNTDPAYAGSKNLTFSGAGSSSNPVTDPTVKDSGGAVVAFQTATPITFGSGVATVSSGNNGVMTLYKAESATISVSDGSISSSGSDRLSVTVSATTAAAIAYTSGNNQSGSLSAALASPFVVTVTDGYGNPVSGTTVTFAIGAVPGGASGQGLSATGPTTAGSGQASSTLTLGNVAGTYTVTATAAGLSGSPVTFTAAAVPASNNGTWTQSTSGGNWGTPGNWSGGMVAYGSTRTANFSTLDLTGDNTVHLDFPLTINSVAFGDTATGTAAGWTLDDNGNAANIITLAGTTPTITVGGLGGTKAVTVNAAVGGAAGLTKAGAGTLVLAGANTFSGAAAVNAGTLRLDYTGQNNAKLASGSALTLTRATLDLSGGSHTEAVNGVTVSGGACAVTRTGGGSVLRLNALTESGYATVDVGAAGIADSDTANNAYNILGGWATVAGADWAVTASSAGDTPVTALATYYPSSSGGDTAANYNNKNADIVSSQTIGAAHPNTLRFNSAGAYTLTLTGTCTLGAGDAAVVGGILVTPAVGNYLSKIAGATLSAGYQRAVYLQQWNTANVLEIESALDNAQHHYVKTGPGTVVLSGGAPSGYDYYNGFWINQGAILFNAGSYYNGPLTVRDGGTLGGSGTYMDDVTVNAGGTMQPSLAGASATLTLASSTSPSFGAYATLKIRAPASTPDKVVLSNSGATFACGNVDLVIDTTGLSSGCTGATIVDASAHGSGGVGGTFHTMTVIGTYQATLHYNTAAGTITLDLAGAAEAAHSTLSPATATKAADGTITQVVTVQARDADGNPRSSGGDTVVFDATAGSMGATTDHGDGTYTATWTAPSSVGAGSATVTATLGGTAVGTAVGADECVITLVPAVDHFDIDAIASPQTAGTPIAITITAKNASNATVTDYTGLTVVFGGDAGVTGTSPLFLAGVCNASVTPTVAGMSLHVTVSDGATPVEHTGSVTIGLIRPGPVSQFTIAPNPVASATAGTPFALTSITAKDVYGNACDSGANEFTGTVTYGGTAGMTGTSAAFSAGVLSSPSVTATSAGSGKTITVDDGSGHTGSATITTVSSASAHAIALTSGNNQNGTTGAQLGSSFVATVTDVYGNPVSGTTVNYAIDTVPGGASGQALSAAAPTTGANGQASSRLTLGDKLGMYTVTATAAGLSGSPVTFTAYAVPASASGTWTQTASGGDWFTAGNWSASAIAYGSGSTADFSTLDLTADNTVHLNQPVTIGSLTFGDAATATAAGWTLDNNGNAANTVTLAGTTPTVTVNALGGTMSATISAAVGGSAGLTKAGAGTLVLAGANTLSGAAAVHAGTLRLDYASQNNAKLASGSALSLTRATLDLSGGTYTEVVNGLTVNAGASAVTRSSGGSVLRLNALAVSGDATVDFGAAGIAESDTANNGYGIVGGWATVAGADWAVTASSAGDTPVTALATYYPSTSGGDTAANYAGQNVDIVSSQTIGAASPNTLRFNSAGAYTLTLTGRCSLGAGSSSTAGGILVTPAVGNNLCLISGSDLGTTDSAVYLQQWNTANVLQIASALNNNQITYVKTGPGTLLLSGGAPDLYDYYNGFRINQGAVLFNTSSYYNGPLTVRSGAIMGGNGTYRDAVTVDAGGTIQPSLSGAAAALTLASSSSPAFGAYSTLKIRAPSSTPDKVVLSHAGAAFACGNVDLVIDAAGLSGGFAGKTIVDASAHGNGGVSGTFHSVTLQNGGSYEATVHYNTAAGTITLDLVGAVNAAHSTLNPVTAVKSAGGVSTLAVTVTARDASDNNRGIGGDAVVFSATEGSVGSATDNGDGTYTATWTAPSSVGSGSATVTATLGGTAVGTAVGASQCVITLVGAVDHFDIDAIGSPQTAGTPVAITITAKNGGGSTVTDYTGATVTFGGTAGVTGASPAFASGICNASVTPTNAGSSLTITMNDGAGHTGSATITTINPGPVSQFTIAPATVASATAGTPFALTSITAKDAYGNACSTGPNAFAGTVTYGGTAGVTGTSAAFSGGVLSSPSVTATSAGSGKTITVTDGSSHNGSATITTVNAGAAHAMALTSGNNQSTTMSTALASPLVVTVTDEHGNPVSGTTVSIAIGTVPGGAVGQSLSASSPQTGGNGQAASTLTLGDKLGTYTVTATAAGLSGSPVTFTAYGVPATSDGTWTRTGSGGSWMATGNWSGGNVAYGSGRTAYFGTLNLTADNTVHVDVPVTVEDLAFGDVDTNTAAGWTLDNDGNAANTVTLAGGTPTLTVNALGGTKAVTISAAIAGSAGLTKAGAGTLVLSGANTYSGATTVSDGAFTLDFANQNSSKLADASTLTLNGTALTLAGGSHTEAVGSAQLGSGANRVVRSGGSATLRMNGVSTSNGGTVDFGVASLADSDTANKSSGILGGWATVAGTDWAATAASASDTAVTAYAGYVNNTWASGNNVNVTADNSVSGATCESLRFHAAAARTLTLSGTCTVGDGSNGGILVSPNVGNNLSRIAGGTLQAGYLGTVYIQQWNTANALEIGSALRAYTAYYVKAGPGTVVLSGGTTGSGGYNSFTINAGAVLFNTGTYNFDGGTMTVRRGGTLGGNGTVANPVAFSAGSTLQPTLSGQPGTLTLSSATAPAFGAASSLRIRATTITGTAYADKVLLSNGAATFACGNLDLVIDTTGLSGTIAGATIVDASAHGNGGVSGAFRSVTVIGNTSYRGTVSYNAAGGTITLDLSAADAAHSTVSAAPALIAADGVSTAVLTVQGRDIHDVNVTAGGETVVIAKQSGTGTVGATTDNGDGTYTATVTAPTATGAGTFVATMNGTAVGTAVGASASVVSYTPGPLDHFAISAIASPQRAGTPITGIMLTAQDAFNNTVTGFGGTVTYSGTAGITGTSGAFTAGVLSGVSVTPSVTGGAQSFIVTGAGQSGSAVFTVLLPLTTIITFE